MNSFAELGLSKQALACLNSIGFDEPTEIQSQTIGPMLDRRDVMASAQTGSGKTAAYALPLIDLLQKGMRKCRVLVIVPTRELALQVKGEFERFGSHARIKTIALYGGTGYDKQTRDLRAGPDVIVATPGRLFDFIENRMVNLSTVEALVLDEADRLMDLGFAPQVRKIVDRIPTDRQTAMFSATFDARVERLSKDYLTEPVRVAVRTKQIEPSSIEQMFHQTSETEKEALLLKLIGDAGEGSVLVFTKTRRKATKVAARLRAAEVEAHEIHGEVSQSRREKTLDRYRQGKFTVLVATDVAARGLDIPAISHVVNYDLPQSPEDYVHRIGRTGRAGRSGCSHTFVCDGDGGSLRAIEKIVGRTLMTRTKPAQGLVRSNAARPAAERAPEERLARVARTAAGRTTVEHTLAERTPAGRTPAGRTSAGRTSEGRTSEWRTPAGRTSAGRTSAGRTSAGRTSEGRTSEGRTSEGRTSEWRTPAGRTPKAGRSRRRRFAGQRG